MASVPQITNPVSGKNYTSPANSSHRKDGGGESFDILELTSPVSETKSSSEKENQGQKTGTESNDFLPVSVKIAKDPTMAVESLKQIIDSDLLTTARENGYTELCGELEDLTKILFLKPENVLNEILLQEKENTAFNGSELFKLLRQLITEEGAKEALRSSGEAKSAAPAEQPLVNNPHLHPLNTNITPSRSAKLDNLRIAVGNVLKAINYVESKDEILTALSSNLKFLSKYFAPNKMLSEELGRLSAEWAKTEASHDFAALKSETLQLLKDVSDSLLNNEHTQVLLPLIIHNLSRYNPDSGILKDYFEKLIALIPDKSVSDKLTAAFKHFFNQITGSSEYSDEGNTSRFYNNTTNPSINQDLNLNFYQKSQIPEFLRENLHDERYLSSIDLDDESINAPVRNYLLGKIDGKTAIEGIIRNFITIPSVKEALAAELKEIDSISTLVEYLNDILKVIPDINARQTLYEGLVEIVNNMAETGELPPESAAKPDEAEPETPIPRNNAAVPEKQESSEKQSVMKPLVEFIEKNIDHSALKTINNYNASNLLQSLINAPGVFTPLAHYILPLEIDDTKAFGELWVDKDESGSGAVSEEGRSYHLFLTFDVEEVGRFEVDLISFGTDINLSLLHPDSFSEKAEPLRKKISSIAAQSGYTPKSFTMGVLKKPHNLTEVFPNLMERRTGFNVKA